MSFDSSRSILRRAKASQSSAVGTSPTPDAVTSPSMNALRKAAQKPSRVALAKRIRPLEDRHLLLVEELADRQQLSTQLLEDAGAEVTLERHALTGVIVAVSMPERFDALILDLKRPFLEIVEASVAL